MSKNDDPCGMTPGELLDEAESLRLRMRLRLRNEYLEEYTERLRREVKHAQGQNAATSRGLSRLRNKYAEESARWHKEVQAAKRDAARWHDAMVEHAKRARAAEEELAELRHRIEGLEK